jgi:putative oxidoreductase
VLEHLMGLRALVLRITGRLGWLPPTLARLSVGLVFFNSGWGKLHGLKDVIEYFRSLGIPAPEIQAPFAAGTEFVCGLLLLLGLFTRIASVPLIITMTVAILTAKKDDIEGISSLFTFSEYLYILLLVYLGVNGPGPLSLDRIVVSLLGDRGTEPASNLGAVGARARTA